MENVVKKTGGSGNTYRKFHKKKEGYFNGYIHASRYPGSQIRTG
jgi:hypothetical protein